MCGDVLINVSHEIRDPTSVPFCVIQDKAVDFNGVPVVVFNMAHPSNRSMISIPDVDIVPNNLLVYLLVLWVADT